METFIQYCKKQVENDERVEQMAVSHEKLTQEDLYGIDCVDVVFSHVQFDQCDLSQGSFVSVKFQDCDLSNSNFENCYFKKCEFVNTKGMGTNLRSSRVLNCLIESCNFQYADFNSTHMQDSEFIESDFTCAVFRQSELKKIRIKGSKLLGNDWVRAKLNGMDFTCNQFEGPVLSTGLPELKGTRFSGSQAGQLVALLGVDVVD